MEKGTSERIINKEKSYAQKEKGNR